MITFNRERHLRDRLVKPCQHSEMINTINLLLKGYFKCGACVFIPTFLVPCIYCFCCLLDFSALYVQRTLFRPKSELHFLYFYYLSVSFSFVPLRISTLTLNKHTAGVFTITTHTITSAGALFAICAILVSMQPLYRLTEMSWIRCDGGRRKVLLHVIPVSNPKAWMSRPNGIHPVSSTYPVQSHNLIPAAIRWEVGYTPTPTEKNLLTLR